MDVNLVFYKLLKVTDFSGKIIKSKYFFQKSINLRIFCLACYILLKQYIKLDWHHARKAGLVTG